MTRDTSIHWRQVDFSGCMLLVGESGYTCREPVDMAGEKLLKKGHDGKHELWVSTLKPGLWARLKEYLALDISLMSLEYKEVYMRG